MSKEIRNQIEKVKKYKQIITENKNTIMKRYDDYQKNKKKLILTKDELEKVEWTKYKIIVPTKEDREELMSAFEYIHNSNIDTDFVAVNQLAHEYLDSERIEGASNNIIVNEKLFNELNKK
jgi:aminopeptidase-like protein